MITLRDRAGIELGGMNNWLAHLRIPLLSAPTLIATDAYSYFWDETPDEGPAFNMKVFPNVSFEKSAKQLGCVTSEENAAAIFIEGLVPPDTGMWASYLTSDEYIRGFQADQLASTAQDLGRPGRRARFHQGNDYGVLMMEDGLVRRFGAHIQVQFDPMNSPHAGFWQEQGFSATNLGEEPAEAVMVTTVIEHDNNFGGMVIPPQSQLYVAVSKDGKVLNPLSSDSDPINTEGGEVIPGTAPDHLFLQQNDPEVASLYLKGQRAIMQSVFFVLTCLNAAVRPHPSCDIYDYGALPGLEPVYELDLGDLRRRLNKHAQLQKLSHALTVCRREFET